MANNAQIARWGDKLWTEDMVNSLKNDYLIMSNKEIGLKYNKSHKAVSVKLNEVGLIRSSDIKRKYTLNEHYFDKIDTPEKAYFLGWLYSDGYNNEKSGSIKIALQEGDKEILEKLNKLINSNRPLEYRKAIIKNDGSGYRQSQYILHIGSRHISNKLSELGVTKAKSNTIKYPEWLPKHLFKSWLTGLFDGDGSLYETKRGDYVFSIEGNYDLIKRVQEILIKEIGLSNNKISGKNLGRKTSVGFKYSGRKQVIKILDWIYKDASIYLKRKHDKYLYIKSLPEPIIRLAVINTETNRIYKDIWEVGKDLNINAHHLGQKLRGKRPNNSTFLYLRDYQKLAI